MALQIHIDELPNAKVIDARHLRGQGVSTTKLVYGGDSSLQHITRSPGFHSAPHAHNCEQLNYVMEGSISFFVDGLEYRLSQGDFLNIPAMAVHWAWNRGDKPSIMMESHAPLNTSEGAYGLFDEGEVAELKASPTIWVSDEYAKGEETFPAAPPESPWWARKASVRSSESQAQAISRVQGSGKLESYFVYGENANMMVATRDPGYHSKPHIHACDQLNLLVDGELAIFIDSKCYLMQPGDFLRIPNMAPHWAFNSGTVPCKLIETHTPVHNPSAKANALPLIPPERVPFVKTDGRNLYIQAPLLAQEEAMIREARARRAAAR